MTFATRVTIALSVALLLGGCRGTPEAAAPRQSDEVETTVAVPTATVEDIGLEPVTFEKWQSELESMRGNIVVVDLWATWCAPCIERFPKMVAMRDAYADRGVRFVSLSLDDRDDDATIPDVTRFLQRQDAGRLSNYLMDEIIPDAFEKLDLLGIPAVFVYDAEGELRYRLTGDDPNNQFTEEDVEQAIEQLLEGDESI